MNDLSQPPMLKTEAKAQSSSRAKAYDQATAQTTARDIVELKQPSLHGMTNILPLNQVIYQSEL